jgi:hypothetical protein
MAWLNFEQYPQGSRLNECIDQIGVPCKANLESTLSLAFPNINKLVSPKIAIKKPHNQNRPLYLAIPASRYIFFDHDIVTQNTVSTSPQQTSISRFFPTKTIVW